MATSPAENATLGRQSLTTVVAARDTDIDPGIADMSTVEDRVAILGMVARTHYESLIDLAPTGQPFERSYVWFCRIDQGQIGGIRSMPNGLRPTQQLGVISELSSNRSPFTRTEPQSQ